MVLFLIVLWCVSALGLVGLVWIKHWELTTGRVLFSEVRPAAGRVLGAGLHFVERRAPAVVRSVALAAYRRARAEFHRAVAWLVLQAERLLERVLTTLRHTTAAPAGGEASAFLREVAEHKKSLMESSGEKQNAIYEE